ncbi:hypothetical protein IJG73_02585 [Candidatus Saccharibacteria bacterium]|nr:hypothetical protein [Candidatus Saccharibacteria bacterium]
MDQSNENELQKAIDDITNGATASQPGAGDDVAADLEAKIQGQMGTPPAPEMPMDGVAPDADMPTMAMPEMPASSVDAMNPIMPETAPAAEAAPVVAAPAETPAAPAAEVSAPVEAAPAEAPVAASGDLGSVKQAMLRDLYPLMDKVELAPERKYDVYKEMIETTGDINMIPAAYEAVKGIADDSAKAEALLYLVDKAK